MIGPDKLEYASVANRLLGKPLDCVRNRAVLHYRGRGFSEKMIDAFCATFTASGGDIDQAVEHVSGYMRDHVAKTRSSELTAAAEAIAERTERTLYDSLKTAAAVHPAN
jgi:hypothetical protein